jgi:hypothetical protein
VPPRRSTDLLAGRLADPLTRWAADLLVLLLTGWLLWPQRHGGYGLAHDMVFTPHQPLNAGSVGLGSASPRAVPLDALVALAGKLLGGQLTGRLALAVPLLLAGWGLIRLVRACGGDRLPALLLAGGLAVWNPFVVERLALGQWALLWCYGGLPWLVLAGCRIRRAPDRWHWAAGGCALAACAITPTGALIGAAVLVTVGWSRRGRVDGALLGLAVLGQLPWLLPALTSAAAATSDPRAVTAFAARAERPGGPLGSLLGLGGIWNAEVTPASRAGLLGYLSTLAVLAALVVGVPLIRPRLLAVRLAWLAAAGLLLAAAATVPGLSALLRWTVREVPGAGLLRDGQKWLMPFVLLVVLAAGLAADRLAGRLTERPAPQPEQPADRAERTGRLIVCAVAAAVLPLLLLPDGPATLRVPLSPVHYPAGWQRVADRVSGSSASVLVLPFASYRSYHWAPGRTVLDPAPRLLGPPVLVDDRLVVGDTVLAGEDPVAARLRLVLTGDPPELAPQLADLGIGWVLVEARTPGPPPPALGGLRQVLADPDVRLYQVPGLIRPVSTGLARAILVIGVDLLLALLVFVAAVALAGRAVLRLLHSPVTFREKTGN